MELLIRYASPFWESQLRNISPCSSFLLASKYWNTSLLSTFEESKWSSVTTRWIPAAYMVSKIWCLAAWRQFPRYVRFFTIMQSYFLSMPSCIISMNPASASTSFFLSVYFFSRAAPPLSFSHREIASFCSGIVLSTFFLLHETAFV